MSQRFISFVFIFFSIIIFTPNFCFGKYNNDNNEGFIKVENAQKPDIFLDFLWMLQLTWS